MAIEMPACVFLSVKVNKNERNERGFMHLGSERSWHQLGSSKSVSNEILLICFRATHVSMLSPSKTVCTGR